MSDDFINMVKVALVLEADDPDDLDELGVQITDLDDSIITMMKYRDRCPRGSARRADFASSINRLKDWKTKLEKKIERAKEAQLKELYNAHGDETLLSEGGVAGHIRHLYDNWDLTFGELKDVLRAASSGELEEVSEKLDGQNLFITWDVSEGRLKAARNKGNIKSGGLDAEGLASKFAGRGSVYDAFVNGFNIISKAIGSLSPKEKVEIFGSSGDVWYSVEIMFVDNPNTIVYDKNNVVFHKAGSAEFDPETGKSTNNDISDKFDKLVARVDAMQDSLADETWRLAKPALMQLQKLESDAPLQQAMSQIDSIMGEYGITDGDSIGVYLKTRVHMELIEPLKLDHKRADALARRIMGEKGSPTVAQVAKDLDPEQKKQVKDVATQGKEFMKVAIAPIEMAIHDFAVEVLRGLESAFIVDNSKEVSRLRGQVSSAIDAIEGSGSDDVMAVLAAQMKKLKRVENVASAMEGIVFRFKGNTYKFTGAFAPANQLIGLFKYGRGKIPPLKVVSNGGGHAMGESLAKFLRIDILNEKVGAGEGGFAYEATVINAINAAGAAGNIDSPAGARATRPDADIKINEKIYDVEVKMDSRAPMGSTSVRWVYGDTDFDFVKPIGDASIESLVKLALSEKIDELIDLLDYLKDQPGNIDQWGFPGTFTKESWNLAVKSGLLRPINMKVEYDASIIAKHYNKKGVYYIQIGGAGLFYMGSNPANLPVPRLAGNVNVEIRLKRAGSKKRKSDGRRVANVQINVSPRLAFKGKSNYTLDDPTSIKRLLEDVDDVKKLTAGFERLFPRLKLL